MTRRDDGLLEKLDFNLRLGDVIRVLYHVALDHCVLRSFELEKLVCVSKDQLVSLLERGYAEKKISELLKSPSLTALNDVEKNEVLVITEDGGSVMSVAMAFSHIEHQFPEWWSVPLPLAFVTKNKIMLNGAADKMSVAKQLALVDCASLPIEQTEFFVTLQEKKKSHSVMFKLLARKIYLIEDVTQDIETANDMVWCAAVGNALTLRLECDGKILWRDGDDIEKGANVEETLVCEWDGKSVGALCIGNKKTKKKKK